MSIASVFDLEIAPAIWISAAACVALAKWLFIGLPIGVKIGRAWSFRTWRLERYLANNPTISPNPADSGKG